MISLTRKSDYALVAVAGLAGADGRWLSARELSDTLRLPLAALRNILKGLASCGLVEAHQGAAGGYRLARAPERITVADVVRAIEGGAKLTPCCHPHSAPGESACRLESSCVIKSSVRSLHDRLNDVLRETTIRDLLDRAAAAGTRENERTELTGVAGTRGGDSPASIATE